jgi:hypothetical protein
VYNYGFDNFVGLPDTHDVGIAILDKPMINLGFGHLAKAGALDSLPTAKGTQDKDFRVSGYGISYAQMKGIYPDKSKYIVTVSYRVRLQAIEQLVNTVAPYNGATTSSSTATATAAAAPARATPAGRCSTPRTPTRSWR